MSTTAPTEGTDVHPLHESSVLRLFEQLARGEHVDPTFAHAVEQVLGVLAVPVSEPGAPFLSVLLRTQGKRIEPLKDALLCLSAQTDESFEVIVIDHDADEAGAVAVREAIAAQPARFRERIRIVEVSGGTRAKPLNAGVAAAHGEYIAVYDDDDLVFANWVEEFHRSAETGGGRLVRGMVANQVVRPELWPQDQEGFRTLSWPKAEYPAQFDQLAHLVVNYSPFMSWCFPRRLFAQFGFRFDEELTVCEDWDVILRGSLLCGVEDIGQITAIYRRWEGGVSSYTEHSRDSWSWSEARVIEKLNDSVILLGPGAVEKVRELLGDRGAREHLAALINSPSWKLARPIRGAVRVVRYGRRAAGAVKRRVRSAGGRIIGRR